MSRILGLDLGDVWVGSALSDAVGITCRPYRTVKADELDSFLSDVLKKEKIETVVVGHPLTVKGQVSEQTKLIEESFSDLQKKFQEIDGSLIQWVLQDERFSTKRAKGVMSGKKRTSAKRASMRRASKEEHSDHAIAAAFILQSYLDSKAF